MIIITAEMISNRTLTLVEVNVLSFNEGLRTV